MIGPCNIVYPRVYIFISQLTVSAVMQLGTESVEQLEAKEEELRVSCSNQIQCFSDLYIQLVQS